MDISTIFYIIFSTIQVGLIYALLSLGFNLLYSSTRIINVAYGELITIGAYFAFWLYTIYSISPLITTAIVALFMIGVSYSVYHLLFKPLLNTRNLVYVEVWGVIITFALSLAIQGIISIIWSPIQRSYAYLDSVISLAFFTVQLNKVIVALVGAMIIIIFYLFLFKTDIGVAIRGVIQDPNLARITGIDVNKIFNLSCILSFIIGGISGVLISIFVDIHPFMGILYIIIAFVVTVIGGIGNPLGSLIGGLVYGFLYNIINYTLGPRFNLIIIYFLLIGLLLLRPKGILGRE